MINPDVAPKSPVPGPPTAPFQGGATRPGLLDPPTVSLLSLHVPRPGGDVQALLRKRLQITSLLAAAGLSLFLLVMVSAFYRDRHWGNLVLHGLILGTMGVLTALSWGRRPLTMRGLRRIELMVFGLIALFFVWLNFHLGFYYRTLFQGTEPAQLQMIALARFLVIKWTALIVG